MKMQKTDIGVVVFMYAVCGFFYAYSSKLSDTSRTYPKFTIALLFFLTSFYLVQMILNARRFGVESGVDTVFAGFKPVQFIVSVALILVYFVLMKYVGFTFRRRCSCSLAFSSCACPFWPRSFRSYRSIFSFILRSFSSLACGFPQAFCFKEEM